MAARFVSVALEHCKPGWSAQQFAQCLEAHMSGHARRDTGHRKPVGAIRSSAHAYGR